jgi:hypothetical protein
MQPLRMFLLFWCFLGATWRLNSRRRCTRFNSGLPQGWVDPEKQLYAMVPKMLSVLWSCVKKISLSWHWMVTILIRGISRWQTVLGKVGHNTYKLRLLDVSCMQPLKTCYAQEWGVWLKNHPEFLPDWLGKLTWNRPQQLLVQTGSGKQACCPANVKYDKKNAWSWENLSATLRVVCLTTLCQNCRRTAFH